MIFRKAVVRAVTCALIAGWYASAPAAAEARNRETSCQEVVKVDGGFNYRSVPGLSVLRLAREDGPFRYEHAGDVVSFTCLRSELMPEAEADLEVLEAGFGMSIGQARDPLRILGLELDEGTIRAKMLVGTLDAREQRRLDTTVAAMQARLDRGR